MAEGGVCRASMLPHLSPVPLQVETKVECVQCWETRTAGKTEVLSAPSALWEEGCSLGDVLVGSAAVTFS